MSQCDTQKGTCSTETHTSQSSECCAVQKSIQEAPCPVENSVDMWNASFFQAMKQAQVEILKEKINKNWGPIMDKEGDAIVEAMGTHWGSILAQAKAKCDLKENFKGIFEEAMASKK